jgi:hypothetical protein
MNPSTSSFVGGILLMVGNLLVQVSSHGGVESRLGLLIMNSPAFKGTRVIDRIVMTNVYYVLDGGTPILYKNLRTMGATESGESIFAFSRDFGDCLLKQPDFGKF